MTVFLDNEFKCHTENDGTMRPYEIACFDGKCKEYIEGMRCIPNGENWTRSDGLVFSGQVTPWKDSRELEKAQLEYELAQYEAALTAIEKALGVNTE